MRMFSSRLQRNIVTRLLQIVIIFLVLFSIAKELPRMIENSRSIDSANIKQAEYTEVNVEACNLSGKRQANSVVDIGYDSDYANRAYYAYTNSTKQLVYIQADTIILQNDDLENNGSERYCSDEAKVKGTESSEYDEGHVIADSLGGVSNSYNITPQDSYLNRKGEQYQMEQFIRDNGGADNFKAIINYPNEFTFTPSSYQITFEINGKQYNYEYKNEGEGSK